MSYILLLIMIARIINNFHMQQKDLFSHYKPVIPNGSQYLTGLKLSNSMKGGELTTFVPIKGRQIKYITLRSKVLLLRSHGL